MSTASAEAVIAALGLVQHPEGGWFRETFRDASAAGERGASTAIYYLLRAGEVSRWHRTSGYTGRGAGRGEKGDDAAGRTRPK